MTLPFCGFSFAVSGSTMPLAVVSSSSMALTINRSTRGFKFIPEYLRSLFRSLAGTLYVRVPRRARQCSGPVVAFEHLSREDLDSGSGAAYDPGIQVPQLGELVPVG